MKRAVNNVELKNYNLVNNTFIKETSHETLSFIPQTMLFIIHNELS